MWSHTVHAYMAPVFAAFTTPFRRHVAHRTCWHSRREQDTSSRAWHPLASRRSLLHGEPLRSRATQRSTRSSPASPGLDGLSKTSLMVFTPSGSSSTADAIKRGLQ